MHSVSVLSNRYRIELLKKRFTSILPKTAELSVENIGKRGKGKGERDADVPSDQRRSTVGGI